MGPTSALCCQGKFTSSSTCFLTLAPSAGTTSLHDAMFRDLLEIFKNIVYFYITFRSIKFAWNSPHDIFPGGRLVLWSFLRGGFRILVLDLSARISPRRRNVSVKNSAHFMVWFMLERNLRRLLVWVIRVHILLLLEESAFLMLLIIGRLGLKVVFWMIFWMFLAVIGTFSPWVAVEYGRYFDQLKA